MVEVCLEEGGLVGGGKGQVVELYKVRAVADARGVQEGATGREVRGRVESLGP